MLQIAKIQEALLHLVGFQQEATSIEGASVSNGLTESESGLYFQQAHPLITLDNLYCIAPDFSSVEEAAAFTGARAVKSGETYSAGNIVLSAGQLYRVTQDVTLESRVIPAGDPSLFAETNLFSVWLERKVKGSIAKVVNRFVTEKYAGAASRPLLESKTLFDGTGRLCDIIPNRNKIAGFELVPIRSGGVTVKINKIGLHFTEAGNYTIYLYHSSQGVKKVAYSGQVQPGFHWVSPRELILLPYSDGSIQDAGGSWYIFYRQCKLPEGSLAVNKARDWSKGPCKSCSRNEYISWEAWSRYLEVHPFSVPDRGADDEPPGLWDISENEYDYSKNWGLNLELSVYCDLTDFIIREKEMFTDLVMKQFAVDMLREFAYNPNVRTNRHSVNASRVDILYELDGDSSSMKKSGLSYQLDQAFKALDVSTRGLDRACLPCKNNGIKYRTV